MNTWLLEWSKDMNAVLGALLLSDELDIEQNKEAEDEADMAGTWKFRCPEVFWYNRHDAQ